MTRPVWRPARQTLAEVLDASPPPPEECRLIRPRRGDPTGPSLSRCPPSHPLADSRSGTAPGNGDANRRRGQMNGDRTGPGPDHRLRPRPRRQTQTTATDSDHDPGPQTPPRPRHGLQTPPRNRGPYLCPLSVPDPAPVAVPRQLDP